MRTEFAVVSKKKEIINKFQAKEINMLKNHGH